MLQGVPRGSSMRRKLLVCKECGYEGTVEVLSPEERRRIPSQPVACPRCHTTNVHLVQR